MSGRSSTSSTRPDAMLGEQCTGRRARPTATQELLLRLHESIPASHALNMSYAVAIDGPLRVDALESALVSVVARHDALRSRYVLERGRVLVDVLASDVPSLTVLDFSASPATALQEAARRAREDAVRPFRPGVEPSVRACLLVTGADRHMLLVSFHHVVADGWSVDVFAREVSKLYAAALDGTTPRLTDVGEGCAGVADAQHRWLAGPLARRCHDYWRAHHEGLDPRALALPSSENAMSSTTRRMVQRFPASVEASLMEVCRLRRASLYTVLATALSTVLATWIDAPDATFGALVANRPTAASSRVLGAHYGAVLFRALVDRQASLEARLSTTASAWLEALEHGSAPFSDVALALADEHDVPADSLPGFMLQIDRHPLHSLALKGTTITPMHLGPDAQLAESSADAPVCVITGSALTFFVREGPTGLSLSVFYKPHLLSRQAVDRLVEAFFQVLSVLAERPGAPGAELRLDLPEWPPRPSADTPATATASTLFVSDDIRPVDALSPVVVDPSLAAGALSRASRNECMLHDC